jgi:hypothetical protein
VDDACCIVRKCPITGLHVNCHIPTLCCNRHELEQDMNALSEAIHGPHVDFIDGIPPRAELGCGM